jgi:hypothetical protein
MEAILNRLHYQIQQLRGYSNYLISIGDLIKYNTIDSDSDDIKRIVANTRDKSNQVRYRKIFEYNSFIISIMASSKGSLKI